MKEVMRANGRGERGGEGCPIGYPYQGSLHMAAPQLTTTQTKPKPARSMASKRRRTAEADLAHNEVWFHFTAANKDLSYLSNFTHVPDEAGFPFTFATKHTMHFSSIELAFHAAKFFHLVGADRPDLAAQLSVHGANGRLVGASQKSAGGRKAFEHLGVALDRCRWDAAKGGIMKQLVEARAAVDPRYVDICRKLVAAGTRIRHFARGVFYRSKATGELVGEDPLGPYLEAVGGYAPKPAAVDAATAAPSEVIDLSGDDDE